MAEKVVAKTTKKKTVPKKATTKVASKSRVVKKKNTTIRKKAVPKKTARKAPTPIASVRAVEKTNNRMALFGIVFFILILGVSIVIGLSGEGQINIGTAISTLKENASQEERDKIDSVSVQKKNTANALVPSGVPVEVPASEPVATTTASSSIDTASSTDLKASSSSENTKSTNEGEDQSVQQATSSDNTNS